MNNFIEYVCRGVMRSEDAIRDLNRKVAAQAKCHRNLAGSVICLGVAGVLLASVILDQDKEIKALRKQVAELAKDAKEEDVTVANDMEENKEQEGA